MGKHRKRKKSSIREEEDNSSSLRIFPTMLASLANVHTHFARSLLKNHLRKLQQQITLNHDGLLSLFPSLLRTTTNYPSISVRCSQVIGFSALSSFETNERICLDSEILRALVEALNCRVKRVSMAACNAILDLSTTLVARQSFCGVSAVDKLMSVFLQEAVSPAKYISLSSSYSGVGITEAEYPVLVLEATVTLINTCNMKQLATIPSKLSQVFLSYLKELWVNVRDQSLLRNPADLSNDRNCNYKNMRIHGLEESIFRLSTTYDAFTITCKSELVKKSIFGPNELDFENFTLRYWEDSPFISSKTLDDHDDIFSSYIGSFSSKSAADAIISFILGGLVSCPPLPSDELDIINFLEEAKDRLGSPIIYGQDIRVVKTVEEISEASEKKLKREVHFFNAFADFCCKNPPDIINVSDVKKCIEAFQEGYTIALRGLEFRSEEIASIADRLAVFFGQPSVGVNAYLTPPNSQGLARHYDDHCVFVCQLLGNKLWTVLPRPTSYLPRLYEPLDILLGSKGETDVSSCRQFSLREGDILYIPRGCLHEACTKEVDSISEMENGLAEFSLHLTFGIEVEPPFEWEGFAHVALRRWNNNQNQTPQLETCTNSLKGVLHSFSFNLLHIGIQLIGSYNPTFRKACLIAAFSSDKHQSDSLILNQKSIFRYVITKIDSETIFSEAFRNVEVAVKQKNEDLFQRMRWLRHLSLMGDTEEGIDWKDPLTGFQNLFLLCNEHRKDAEAVFMQMKSKFCKEIVFDNICESFKTVVHKYKRVRTQYKNGMLSLHHNTKDADG
ncbi:hypothetical protein GIB67_013848 [Kingdonia uniflora]|uniref:Bifunctional lysine-specific demethylase and histidyl-hydroxylase n=1 Tax=Kingdonia uniflora TaxID=39325 RepID=A0A7J7N3I5_9MAGN|nr:hypothetical protein GIB67_013848 [Kingdonia uniflora]